MYPDEDLAAAQSVAWTYVASGPWPELTTLQSRKALAEAGGYSGDAASDVKVFVDTPRRHGAAATDIWTWRQTLPEPDRLLVRRASRAELPVADRSSPSTVAESGCSRT